MRVGLKQTGKALKASLAVGTLLAIAAYKRRPKPVKATDRQRKYRGCPCHQCRSESYLHILKTKPLKVRRHYTDNNRAIVHNKLLQEGFTARELRDMYVRQQLIK